MDEKRRPCPRWADDGELAHFQVVPDGAPRYTTEEKFRLARDGAREFRRQHFREQYRTRGMDPDRADLDGLMDRIDLLVARKEPVDLETLLRKFSGESGSAFGQNQP